MNDIMGNDRGMPPPNISTGPPPPPIRTQQTKSQRHAPTNRPDMNMARGNNDGVSMMDSFETIGPKPTQRSSASNKSTRPEMSGPSDISDILSGLKTKNINIQNNGDKDSKISVQELKEMNETKPSGRGKRRQKSDKNTVALHL